MALLLQRSGKAPLRIAASPVTKLARLDGRHFGGRDHNRWYEVVIYTAGDTYAASVAYQTLWEHETEYHWATLGSAQHVARWLTGLYDPPVPPVWGYPPSPQYADRQQALVANLRAQWHQAIGEVLNHELFAVSE